MLVYTFVEEVLDKTAFIVCKREWTYIPSSAFKIVEGMLTGELQEEVSRYGMPPAIDNLEKHQEYLNKFFGQSFIATWSFGFWLTSMRLHTKWKKSGSNVSDNSSGGWLCDGGDDEHEDFLYNSDPHLSGEDDVMDLCGE